MAKQWRVISLEEAKQHPLYGVKNWLAVFAFGVLLSMLRELGTLGAEAGKIGMTLGEFLAIDHPAIMFAKITLALNAAIVAVIYWLLLSKHPKFRSVASALLLCSWPAIALVGAANSFPGLGNALAMSLFSWAVSCAVWVTYLQRSKRVRVTFEHCVLHEFETRGQAVSPPATSASRLPIQIRRETPSTTTERKPRVVANNSLTEEQRFYDQVANELEAGTIDKGLWARYFAETDGNENITKARYIKARVANLAKVDRAAEKIVPAMSTPVTQVHGPESPTASNPGNSQADASSDLTALISSYVAERRKARGDKIDKEKVVRLCRQIVNGLDGTVKTRNTLGGFAGAEVMEVSIGDLQVTFVTDEQFCIWLDSFLIPMLSVSGNDKGANNGR